MIRICKNGHINAYRHCFACDGDTFPVLNRPEDRARTPEQIAYEKRVQEQMRAAWAETTRDPARQPRPVVSIRPRYRRIKKVVRAFVGTWPQLRKPRAARAPGEIKPSRRMVLRDWRRKRAA